MLESLLSRLQSAPVLTENGVTGVTRVTSSIHAGFRCNPRKEAEVTGVTTPKVDGELVTSVTPCNPAGVTRRTAPILDVTLVTSVTPKIIKVTSEFQETASDERRPPAPLSISEETVIRSWLSTIGETDPATIAEVLERCQRDVEARDYFIGRAGELPEPDPFPDDRRTCGQCDNLVGRRCQAAKRGEIVASRNYEPIRDLPRRCEGYAPGAADTDRRHGRERWPWLTDTNGKKTVNPGKALPRNDMQ